MPSGVGGRALGVKKAWYFFLQLVFVVRVFVVVEEKAKGHANESRAKVNFKPRG